MKTFCISLLFLSTIMCYQVHSQRNFFIESPRIVKCDTLKLFYDNADSTLIIPIISWNIEADSVKIFQHFYFPFTFSVDSNPYNNNYVRYFDKKILIIHKSDSLKKEEILFDFSQLNKSWSLSAIYGLGGSCTIKYVSNYYSSTYNEDLYVFNFVFNYYPISPSISEIHIGLNYGITKVIFDTHYNAQIHCCRQQ